MTSPPYPLVPAPVTKSWLDRNTRWKTPLGCLLVMVLLGAFFLVVFAIVETSFRNSTVYQEALARAEHDPRVITRLGIPLKPGRVLQGQINVSGSTGQANLAIPVTGPRGRATVILEASKVSGSWVFRTLEVQVEGQSERVNLLEADGVREQ